MDEELRIDEDLLQSLTGAEKEAPAPAPTPQVTLEEVIRFVMQSPEAQQALAGIFLARTQAAPTTPPVDPDEARLQELEQKLSENPQDWQTFMEVVGLRARIEARKATEPVRLQAQAELQLEETLRYLQQRDPNFARYGQGVATELRQLIMRDPSLAKDPATLRATAEVVADRHFAQWVRTQAKRPPLSGPGVSPGGKPQSGLAAEVRELYEQAKAIYPDLTPEDFQKYYSKEATYLWSPGGAKHGRS